VIWAIFYGEWPSGQVDHINGVRDDNRIVNMRDVSHQDNCRNAARPRTNTSGVSGVVWDKPHKKWRAEIRANGKMKNLGRFAIFDDAVAVRKSAEVEYGYHPNHGRPMM